MSDAGQKFVLWSKTEKHAREGTVLDIDTGVLRRGHVLVLRSPQAEITLGLGTTAGVLIDFAEHGEKGDDPLLAACSGIDMAIARGDLAKSRALGIPDVITMIEDQSLRRLALIEYFLSKASADDPVHPGYPAGTPGGLGGKFMPKDKGPEALQELKRLEALRAFRAGAQAAMVLLTMAPLEGVPGVDVGASVRAALELGRIAIELGNDVKEINEAMDFVRNGPYGLDELRVDPNDVSFSSFDQFKKSPAVPIIKRYPIAGSGNEYHHIVEQGGDNSDNFTPEQLQSTRNIIPLPGPMHDLVTAEYAKEYDESGKSVREWLSGQSFEDQWNEGVKILSGLGIVK